MPIYEYRCDECGKRSSALLASWSAPDPACPHCGRAALRRQVSSFATVRSEEVGFEGGDGFDDDDGGGGGFGGGGFGGDDFGGGDFGDDDW